MPAYNEGHHIYRNIKETCEVLQRSGCPFEVILVNDGSSDETLSEALRAARDMKPVEVISLEKNAGKGHALKEGFTHATGDYVVFLDSDLDLHPNQLTQMLRLMDQNGADVIIGSKHHPSSRLNYPFSRKVFSRVYAFMLKVMFGLPLRDTQTGLKVFRKETLSEVFPRVLCKRYAFDVELLANAHRAGFRVMETPVVLDYRREMMWGRIRAKDVYYMGLDTMAIFYRMHIIRYYGRPLARQGDSVRRKAINQ